MRFRIVKHLASPSKCSSLYAFQLRRFYHCKDGTPLSLHLQKLGTHKHFRAREEDRRREAQLMWSLSAEERCYIELTKFTRIPLQNSSVMFIFSALRRMHNGQTPVTVLHILFTHLARHFAFQLELLILSSVGRICEPLVSRHKTYVGNFMKFSFKWALLKRSISRLYLLYDDWDLNDRPLLLENIRNRSWESYVLNIYMSNLKQYIKVQ